MRILPQRGIQRKSRQLSNYTRCLARCEPLLVSQSALSPLARGIERLQKTGLRRRLQESPNIKRAAEMKLELVETGRAPAFPGQDLLHATVILVVLLSVSHVAITIGDRPSHWRARQEFLGAQPEL